MIKTQKPKQMGGWKIHKGITLAGIISVMLSLSSDAAVIWTFSESGGNVTAVASGSFAESYVSGATDNSPGEVIIIDGTTFFSIVGNYNLTLVAAGSASTTPLTTGSNNPSGSFGHNGGGLFWDAALGMTLNAGAAISAQVTWNSTTIDALFSSSNGFDEVGETIVAWTSHTNPSDTISYVHTTTVPEPSSLSLLGLGGLALMLHRRK